jgi:putative tricarboxylic transport membrane protein
VQKLGGSACEGIRAVFTHFGLFTRSSFIGTIVGIIPGIGGTAASFAAYGQAVQTSRPGPIPFGEGDLRGVLAPEAANDAKDGASLVPTLAFGVPGSEGTAILLAALLLHGITPGKELFANQLPLVFALIWALFLSNWITSLLGLALVRQLARLTVIRINYLAPFILWLSPLAALLYRGSAADIGVVFIFGITGYLMKKHGWPRVALIIALVLGPVFETNLHLSVKLHQLGRIVFWHRPAALAIAALAGISFLWPMIKTVRERSHS